MKKIITILFIFAIILTSSCVAFAERTDGSADSLTFSDVKDDFWASGEIYSLTEQGIVSGYPDGTFRPENKLQRGEFAKMLATIAEVQLQSPQKNTYADVKPEDPLFQYVEAMSYCFTPFSNKSGNKPLFKPNNFVKREDAAYALVKLYNLDKTEDGKEIDVDTGMLDDLFKDSKAISTNKRRYVAIAAMYNLISGNNGYFNPHGILTRADICVLAFNAMNTFSVDSDSEILTINPKYVDPLAVGDVVKLKAIMTSRNGSRDISADTIWDSLSPDIVSVTSDGKITALSKGEARITAQSGGQLASINIVVNVGAPKDIKITPEKVSIKLDDSYQLRAIVSYPDGTILDGNNSNAKMTWKSSNEKVAVVDSKGRIRGISAGKTIISVYFNDFPTVKGICEVNVEKEELENEDGGNGDIANLNTEDSERIVDNIDLPFVNDPEIIGKWVSVDFVKEIEDFNPARKNWQGDLYLKEMIFYSKGETFQPWWTWTKGYIMHSGDKTASSYIIKEINGEKYMFMQWKSGDYTIRHMKPYYYVLKLVG